MDDEKPPKSPESALPSASEEDRAPLVELYRDIAALTAVECGSGCKVPYNCCHPAFCKLAIAWAREKWGVTLEPTGHARLPLLGPQGCIAAPHLRPVCSVHACCVAEFGGKPGQPEWTARYHKLKNAILAIEDPEDQFLYHGA
jgi:hypothetical protein